MDYLKHHAMKKILILSFILLSPVMTFSQDLRTTETRVADLLAAMPANSIPELKKQMVEMGELGPEGRDKIISLIAPPGSANDTGARFAVESYSRYLSDYGHDDDKFDWESECINAVLSTGYPMVRSFFLSQLKYIGTDRSASYASGFLTDPDLCKPAVAVIASADSYRKEDLLAVSLQISNLPCAASVMNELAAMKSDKAVNEYISWYKKGGREIRTAALNAMAGSASKAVRKTLESAASDASYAWESEGSAAALVQYARNIADRGEIKITEEICAEIISKATLQYKIAALEALVDYKGYEAMHYLVSAYTQGEIQYRMAALRFAEDIPGKAATRKWIDLFTGMDEQRKAEIIYMLGERGDLLAVDLIENTLYCPSASLRTSSAIALAKLKGRDAVSELIDYIRSYETVDDQRAAYHALLMTADTRKRDLVADALEGSGNITKATLLMVLAAGGENRFFDIMMDYTVSLNPNLRTIAFMELKNLAEPHNQKQLTDLLLDVSADASVEDVQQALIAALQDADDKQEKISMLISAMQESGELRKFIPVLAELGGKKALQAVYREFKKGNAEIRAVAFDALTGWSGIEALDALYDICASGNKNYSERAFYAYLDMVSESSLSNDEKLSLLQEIEPYALTDSQKEVLNDKINEVKESQRSISDKLEEEKPGRNFLTKKEKNEGFNLLFNGKDLDNWTGNKDSYMVEDGMIVVRPEEGSGGKLFTENEYSDFILRFEFILSSGANNGLGIRAPLEGDAAYEGMELQILDNTAEIYAGLQPYQYHGSVYGVIPARRGFLKPPGEWNHQEVIADGSKIKVVLNGTVIVDGDIEYARKNGAMDKRDHPGLKRNSGHIGFLGHGSELKFRNIKIKEL